MIKNISLNSEFDLNNFVAPLLHRLFSQIRQRPLDTFIVRSNGWVFTYYPVYESRTKMNKIFVWSEMKWNYYNSNIVLYSLVIVAEVTQPSLGVGYELGRAVAMGKRILCLYRPQENKRKFTPFFTKKILYV